MHNLMFAYSRATVLFLAFGLLAPSITFAQNTDAAKALLEQVQTLQAQLAQMKQNQSQVQSSACPSLNRTLTKGMKGDDVRSLQSYLIARGFLSGQPTGSFGTQTQLAVQKLQRALGVAAIGTPSTTGYGAVGSRTRLAITDACTVTTIPLGVPTLPLVQQGNAATLKGRFVASDAIIPTGAFRAYYFDSSNPKVALKNEIVKNVVINYPLEDGPGFNLYSEKFGGYWVGFLETPTQETRTISVAQSWSEARIVVDGKEVYSGGSSKSFDYVFTPGRHLVEVEYLNHWHTTGFSVGFQNQRTLLDAPTIRKQLESIMSDPNADVWIAGPYESSDTYNRINISLKSSSHPVVLVLSSYSPAYWMYPSDSSVPVRAVVLSSFEPGSDISGLPSSVPVYFYKGWIESFATDNLVPICPAAESFCSQESDFRKAARDVQSITGKKPTGAGGAYGIGGVVLPEVYLNDASYVAFDKKVQEAETARAKYQQSQTLEGIR